MKCKVIGIGAAGNKAAIELIERHIVLETDVMLVNSTVKDIPEKYRSISTRLSDTIGGCGKEREVAKSITLEAIESGKLNLDGLMDPDSDLVIIVNSSEGGTGCGASVIIAKYMKSVIGANVHCFVFTGFEEDSRGLQNTIQYFQELSDNFAIEAISNKKFLGSTKNKLKAEKAANIEFANRIQILLGSMIVDSEQNIDETDLYKVSTTPGFMTIEHENLEKIKNVGNFNETLSNMIDNSYSLDASDLSSKRIAIILNVSEKTRDSIDYSFEIIKEKFGSPYEIFTHIQYEGEQEYICIIVSGMHMPINDVKQVYELYKKETEKVNKNKDNFFSFMSDIEIQKDDSMFNMLEKKNDSNIKKEDFLKEFDSNILVKETAKKKKDATIRKEDFMKEY